MARIDLYRDGRWVSSVILGNRTYLVGRDALCDLVLKDELSSRRHFELVYRAPGEYLLKDLDTSNGTLVNGVREFQRPLTVQSTLQVGNEMILFDPDAEGETPEDDDLPAWAFDGLEDDDDDGPSTAHIAPAHLQRLQAKVRARTRPHLVWRRAGAGDVFALDTTVTPIGWGHVRISLGAQDNGKDKVLAEVTKGKKGDFKIKAKGLFGKIEVNGAAKKEHTLKEGDKLTVGGESLEFHAGLLPRG